jgi:hypothetical protein
MFVVATGATIFSAWAGSAGSAGSVGRLDSVKSIFWCKRWRITCEIVNIFGDLRQLSKSKGVSSEMFWCLFRKPEDTQHNDIQLNDT